MYPVKSSGILSRLTSRQASPATVSAARYEVGASAGFANAFRFLSLGVIFAALLRDLFLLIDLHSSHLDDFASYYLPAKALTQFPSVDPYNFDALTQLNTAAHLVTGPLHPFVYPPATLLLLRPLTALSYSDAAHIWTLLSHACAIATAVLLADAFAYVVRKKWQATGAGQDRMLDQVYGFVENTSFRLGGWTFPTVPVAICLAALLFAYPTQDTLYFGQINLVVLFFLVLGLHAHLYNRPILAGVSIAIAGALKLSPLFMLAFFFVRGSWKALFWSLGVSALFAALPLLLISPHVFSQYSAALSNFDANIVPFRWRHNESLVGLLIQIAALRNWGPVFWQQVGEVLGVILSVIGLGLLLVASWFHAKFPWWRNVRSSNGVSQVDLDWLAFAFVLVTYLLATPVVWTHYYDVALPAVLAIGAYPLLRRRAAGEGWAKTDSLVVLGAVIALAFVTIPLPLNADHAETHASALVAMWLRSIRVLGLLIVWGLSVTLVTPMARRIFSAHTVPAEQTATAAVSAP